MPRHGPELIAALAEGTLDPEVAARLEREIAADPRSAAELAAQRAALEALRMAPPPELSALERASLHEAVAAAVHLERTTTASAPATRRRVPWGPIAVAAASLAGLLVAVPLIGLLSVGGGDDATTETVALATTEAADRDENPAPEAAPSLAEESLVATADDAEGAAGGVEFAAETTTTVIAMDPGTTAAPATTTLRRRLDGETALAEFLAGLQEPAELDALEEECSPEAAKLLTDSPGRAVRIFLEAGEAIVWFTSAEDGTVTRALVFDPADCLLLAEGP